jgi:hypothetical protein
LAATIALLVVGSQVAGGALAEEPRSTGYPAVGDVPPRPDKPAMTVDEISKMKKDLTAVRDRQAPKGKPDQGAARKH